MGCGLVLRSLGEPRPPTQPVSQDILIDGGEAAEAGSPDGELSEDDDQTAAALAGRFMLNGVEVPLEGVRSNDSLAHKVEALRMFLDQKLGTQAFLKVYRRLESLSLEDDESEVSRDVPIISGPGRSW
ncbi:protein kinase domain-containing protein [Haematococcus lacustris]|uniref:Protein kinase domain-containing protein n=1 Tax=Haematococcus lacustris TaxID=44745 RepID=A0A6A0ADQ8_HAELA|nr:protein kinase domain-containing protein [Haematococcus lacustris]